MRMRRKSFGSSAAVSVALVALLSAQSAAHADDASKFSVRQETATGYCEAQVVQDLSRQNQYAAADFFNYKAGLDCIGWLERYHNGGWTTISGYHTVLSTSYLNVGQTGWYWNGEGGYSVRACFKFTFSSAAVHCTLPLAD